MRLSRRPLAALVAATGLALSLAACGSDDSAPAASNDSGGAFPVTITHTFGTTTIPAAPQRVLALGFNEQDFVLAFGVVPVGVREFLGYDAPNRPWAPASVRGKDIATVGSQEINYEKIAELRPDLIMAVNAYIDKAAYAKLSAIAPTVAQSADYADGATPWQQQTLLTGLALGQEDKAKQIVDKTEALFADAAKKNPSFKGKQARFALGADDTGTFSVGQDDYRSGWLVDLGFKVPAKSGQVSLEQLATMDKDVLIAEGVPDNILTMPVVQQLDAIKDDRFLDLGQFDQDFAAALGFNSPLSLPTLLDIAVPRLAAATDDDPATTPAPYPGD